MIGTPGATLYNGTMRGSEFVRLSFAIALARERHAGQLDKSGQPFIAHPLRVMARLAGTDDELARALRMIAGVLHDTREDTATTDLELRRLFGDRVADVVDLLTHRKGGETYRAYIDRLSADPDAVAVKLADIADNSDAARLAPGAVLKSGQPLADWHEGMVRTRYVPAVARLTDGVWP